jgi:hypothetical protein
MYSMSEKLDLITELKDLYADSVITSSVPKEDALRIGCLLILNCYEMRGSYLATYSSSLITVQTI